MTQFYQRLCQGRLPRAAEYLVGLGLLGAATLLCEAVDPLLLSINLLMIYQVTVVIAALHLNLLPSLVSVVGSAFIFNYLYLPPRYGFNFEDKEYLATFFGFLITGVVISSLVKKMRDKTVQLHARETETASLYLLSRELAAASDEQSVLRAAIRNVEYCLAARAILFLNEDGQLRTAAASEGYAAGLQESELASLSFSRTGPEVCRTGMRDGSELLCVPIRTSTERIGILAAGLPGGEQQFSSSQTERLLSSFADQTGMALERVHLVKAAEKASSMIARQKIERALLNSVSHDLRTPLATITGVLSSVLDEAQLIDDAARKELLENARSEADRLNRFVGKLLDITRLEAGGEILKIEPCDIQELIGCALAAVDRQIGDRKVSVQLDIGLPLMPMDMVLMNQVLVNLLDNALKYSPVSSPIRISASCDAGHLVIQVTDQGPGVPEGELPKIFEKFYRIAVPEGVKGTGLGLSICHGIVEAHGGTIQAANLPGGGFSVSIRLPGTCCRTHTEAQP